MYLKYNSVRNKNNLLVFKREYVLKFLMVNRLPIKQTFCLESQLCILQWNLKCLFREVFHVQLFPVLFWEELLGDAWPVYTSANQPYRNVQVDQNALQDQTMSVLSVLDISWGIGESHWGFIFHSPDGWWCGTSLPNTYWSFGYVVLISASSNL